MSEAHQEIRKEEFDIVQGPKTCRRLWRPFSCMTETNMKICCYVVPKHMGKPQAGICGCISYG
jgi:hypothetical protein